MEITDWTRVDDPATLKTGDRVRAKYEDFEVEGVLAYDMSAPDQENEYWLKVKGLPTSDVFLPADDTEFYRAETPYEVLDRFLEPGEVVEDREGVRYMQNPFNPARVIDNYSGMTVLGGMSHIAVRPVR